RRRVQSDFDAVTDQARRHRVGSAADPDRAPAADRRCLDRVARHRLERQRPKLRPLFRESLGDVPIVAVLERLLNEALVVLDAGEVATASQDQRLPDQLLSPTVTLLDRAVFVRLTDVDPPDLLEAEVIAHVGEALVEAATLALAELVRGR